MIKYISMKENGTLNAKVALSIKMVETLSGCGAALGPGWVD